MRYAQIRNMDISNGEHIGVSLFVQGCRFHCKGCFNKETWDFNGGKEWTEEVENKFFELIDKPYIKRVSILGGEPLVDENRLIVLNLIKKIKDKYPEKKIWLYTGYTFDELCDKYIIEDMWRFYWRYPFTETSDDIEKVISMYYDKYTALGNLQYVDVLVDGRYMEDQRDLTLKFRGSKNQRLIDMQRTLKEQKIVLYN